MSRTIVIDPVTRIEGHAKITIHLDASGNVADARFHVAEFRGFEKFCEGRLFDEMPTITSRVCGICPVSHLLASAKAGDAILAVEIPEAAVRLRRLVNYAQIVQSHALSFFHLSSPDLLLGYDADPLKRNILGVAAAHPDIARGGIRLRQFGQRIIEILGGKKVHPSWVRPGGVAAPLTSDGRMQILEALPEAMQTTTHTIGWFKDSLAGREAEAQVFGNFPSLFLGMVTPDGQLEHYDGRLRVVDAEGRIVADQLDPARYSEFLGEAVEPWSYVKFAYYKPLGYPAGLYRVGPLARLNVASSCGTPLADREHEAFRQLGTGAVLSSFHYHYARLIEILYSLERIGELLNHPEITSSEVLAKARPNRAEGVGASEAPRGTLFHHYKVDGDGKLKWVDLLIATGQNNLAMNRAIRQIAEHHLKGAAKLSDGILNRIEAGIRAFDPCLSCSTHALGQMPMQLQLVDAGGRILDERTRR
jgi:NAD-reducing hydrogenase large subunit